MAFNFAQFLANSLTLAPILVLGSKQLASQTGTTPDLQQAANWLNLAAGGSQALLQGNPEDQALAALAAGAAASIINLVAGIHGVTGTPAVPPTPPLPPAS